MAMYQATTGPVAATASTTKTFLDLVSSAGTGITINKWWVGSDAVSAGTATSDIRVQVGRFSAAVTTHSALTVTTFDAASFLASAATVAGFNTTAEGAGTAVSIEEHPLGLTQSELVIWEPNGMVLSTGQFWRIRLIIPANIGATNIYAGVMWTE